MYKLHLCNYKLLFVMYSRLFKYFRTRSGCLNSLFPLVFPAILSTEVAARCDPT